MIHNKISYNIFICGYHVTDILRLLSSILIFIYQENISYIIYMIDRRSFIWRTDLHRICNSWTARRAKTDGVTRALFYTEVLPSGNYEIKRSTISRATSLCYDLFTDCYFLDNANHTLKHELMDIMLQFDFPMYFILTPKYYASKSFEQPNPQCVY